ncbi:hypothetical protein EYF80_011352 [Liparis tanakae]|uniref:Uncharacterized protein n=1 Tax=Liparis tanakae TaxID=230148 RepID=A0A4Z2IKU5_9TELE|nr:hypothetical protein EYF80_011352 [Liparis tanakae]
MKKTFACDQSMIITIPIGSLKDAGEGQLMPEKFQCVYKDSYKVFAIKGKPKPLGAAQAIAGVFILVLGLISSAAEKSLLVYTLPSALAKLSFSLNITSFFWSIAAVGLCFTIGHVSPTERSNQIHEGIKGLIVTLLVIEKLIALSLIYWLSKAVCRQHFNTLPIIRLKHGD